LDALGGAVDQENGPYRMSDLRNACVLFRMALKLLASARSSKVDRAIEGTAEIIFAT